MPAITKAGRFNEKHNKKPLPKPVDKTGAARHARLGPSGYKSVEICPSYLNDGESSKAADEGTMLHGILEKHGEKAYRSKEYKALGDERQIQMIDMCADYIRPLTTGKVDLHETEVELDLTFLAIEDTDVGTADIVCGTRALRHVDVVDYKFGWLPVDDAEENIQGILYALGAFNRIPWADDVTVHFLQPRRDEISTGTFTRDQMPELALRARTIAARVKSLAGIEFNPVAANCMWCANKHSCKVMLAMVLKLEGKIPMKFPEAVKTWVPGNFKDAKLGGELYDFVDVLNKWTWAMKDRITEMAVEGYEIPGHDLKTRRGNTSLIDVHEALDIAKEKFNLPADTVEDVLKFAEPSLHGLENAIGALQPRGAKGASKDLFRAELAKAGLLEHGRPSRWLESTK